MFSDKTIDKVVSHFGSRIPKGLTEEEALSRLFRDGKNEMKTGRKKGLFWAFFEQLNDPLIYVLIAAAAVSVLMRETSDAVIIGVVVLMNAAVGVAQEGKARKALESLQRLTSPKAAVIRGGIRKEIDASGLVAGDLVCLEAGNRVPADLRLIRTFGLKVEESALTGESLPVEKSALFLAKGKVPLGDRKNMAYMSTIVTGGRGEGIVTATGMHTQIGQIAGMITGHREEPTPLQKRLGELGKVLSILSLGLCGTLILLAAVQKRDILRMLLTAISLAVAAVPEGLPAVVTICLALSVTRMARANTIVRRLPSVETLGSVSVVCSDKTGTLTQNRMEVQACYLDGREYTDEGLAGLQASSSAVRSLMQGLALCCDAVLTEEKRLGDPTELALLDFAKKAGLAKEELEAEMPRIAERAFDSERKMMSTCHKMPDGRVITYTKGAPEKILERCTGLRCQGKTIPMTAARRREILAEAKKLSGEALRTLVLGVKEERADFRGRGEMAGTPAATEQNLTFVGMVGMKDPPRPEAGEAVEIFRRAGVGTVMITGDHVDTACAVGRQLGIVREAGQCMTGEEMERLSREELSARLDDVRVFARVSPAQKVQIVKGFQEKGNIVAMTGDGVNDAPSLQAADIGIAMGMTGTDVAKEASDMVLADDNFATIEKAIEEGRGVYENIRKSVIFLLSSNLGEIMTMFAAVICGLASPLKSSHILWINLITDSLPALALGVDRNDTKSLMNNTPRRPGESLFARGGLLCTCFYGLLITAASLTVFFMLPINLLRMEGAEVSLGAISGLLCQEAVLSRAQTYAFTVLGMSQLFHAVGMRDVERSVFRMNHLENKLMLLSIVSGFALQCAVTEIPFLVSAFGTARLTAKEWAYLAMMSAIPLAAHEVAVFAGKPGAKK